MRVHLNCAASLDGRLAAPDGRPLRLSGEADLGRVHALRATHDAILVGVGTVLADDPSLRVKGQYAAGPDPLRVILDTHGRTPRAARVVDGEAPGLVLHGPDAQPRFAHAQAAPVALGPAGLDVDAVLAALEARGVDSLLVEGGGRVLRSFLEAGRWHAFTLYQAPVLVGGLGPQLWPGAPADPPFRCRASAVEALGPGAVWTFSP